MTSIDRVELGIVMTSKAGSGGVTTGHRITPQTMSGCEQPGEIRNPGERPG
jgi:hypothetical protein